MLIAYFRLYFDLYRTPADDNYDMQSPFYHTPRGPPSTKRVCVSSDPPTYMNTSPLLSLLWHTRAGDRTDPCNMIVAPPCHMILFHPHPTPTYLSLST